MEVPLEERSSHLTVVALRRLVGIALTLVLAGALTYVVPHLQRVRPWVGGEGVPVVRLFAGERQTELPDFQGATATAAAASPAPIEAAENDTSGPTPTGVTVSPHEYADVAQPIENAAALSTFYEALRHSAQAEPRAITRVAHYGDSAVAADEITCTARRKLQARFGDSGHGFMLTARGTMFYGHRDVSHRESSGWELASVVRRALHSGHYGYGGVVASGHAGEYTSFGTVDSGPIGHSVARFELFYQRFASGGELRLSVDGAAPQSVNTRAAAPEDAWETIRVPDGDHSLVVRARGDVRVYGVSQERDTPGVVYDALGLVGARADRLLDANPRHMSLQIAHRDPHLLVLGFGGNEAGDWLDAPRYEHDLNKVIKLMRAGKPNMSCLLFGPLDQGQRNARGDIVTLRTLPTIIEVQRRVAVAQGCAFFDAFQAMGGEGSVGRWYRARPRLFSPDFRHATPEGYAQIGKQYYEALLKGFAEYLGQH